jgi:hypothetical protein
MLMSMQKLVSLNLASVNKFWITILDFNQQVAVGKLSNLSPLIASQNSYSS